MNCQNEFARLVEAFLDGSIDAQGVEQLLACILADPPRRRDLADAMRVQGMLAEHSRSDTGAEELAEVVMRAIPAAESAGRFESRVVDALRSRRRRPPARPARRRRVAQWSAAAIVAAAAALVAAAMLFSAGPREQESRRIVSSARRRAPSVSPPPPPAPAADDAATRPRPEEPASITSRPEEVASDDAGAQARVDDVAALGAATERTTPTPDAETSVQEGPLPLPDGGEQGAPHVAYVDQIEGAVELATSRAGAWYAARAGMPLARGSRVRTRFSRGRIAFESGSVLWVNRFTTLTVDTIEGTAMPLISLVGGEVYVETVVEDKGFIVDTPHGRAVDLGTRFTVDAALSRTRVTVVEGTVEAATDKGTVTVEANREVLLARRTSPPGRVSDARDLEQRLAWIPEAQVQPPAPVVGWLFDEGSGATASDSWGGLVGALRNMEESDWITDTPLEYHGNRALEYDGANEYVNVPPHPSLGITGDITISAWVRRAGRAAYDAIVAKGNGKDDWDYDLFIKSRDEFVDMLFFHTGPTHSKRACSATKTIADTSWHHVVVTRSGSTVTFYIDGIFRGRRRMDGAFDNHAYPLKIATDGPGWGRDSHFEGRIDEVAIWNRALRPENVRWLSRHSLRELKRGR